MNLFPEQEEDERPCPHCGASSKLRMTLDGGVPYCSWCTSTIEWIKLPELSPLPKPPQKVVSEEELESYVRRENEKLDKQSGG
jgi:hypothetical protein